MTQNSPIPITNPRIDAQSFLRVGGVVVGRLLRDRHGRVILEIKQRGRGVPFVYTPIRGLADIAAEVDITE